MRLKRRFGFKPKKVKIRNVEYQEEETHFGRANINNTHTQKTKAKGDFYGRRWYPVSGAGKKGHKPE